MWRGLTSEELGEDLARALIDIVSRRGLEAASIRALGRSAKVSPGTITNVFESKLEMMCTCTVFVGRWMCWTTSDRLITRGLVGLFPTASEDDREFRDLVLTWAQLEVHGLISPAVDERVRGANMTMRAIVQYHLRGQRSTDVTSFWAALRGLQLEAMRPRSPLSPEEAARLLVA